MMADITLNKAETKIVLTALGYALGVCESKAETRGKEDARYDMPASRAVKLLVKASTLIAEKVASASLSTDYKEAGVTRTL